MHSEVAIKVENLSKCYHIYAKPSDRLLQMLVRNRKQFYRKFWALNDVSFELNKGGAFGIIGRNGSGKSTLLQIICGTVAQTSGTTTNNGRIAALLELGSGFNSEFSGRENVYVNAAVLGLTTAEIDQRFDKIAAFADIGEFMEQPVKTYSSGMYLRLAFAVAAHVDADILIIDEALAVGDALFTQKCMRFLRDFKTRGTLLFVSHDAGAITGLCDTALWLHNGAAMAIGPSKEVSEQYLAFLYESNTPGSARKLSHEKLSKPKASSKLSNVRSAKYADVANKLAKRDEFQIFQFQPGVSQEFGLMGARIRRVVLMNTDGSILYHIVGGEDVTLRIEIDVITEIDQPIVGFSFKDRLGQVLFADNTYLTYRFQSLSLAHGAVLVAEFSFVMPTLPVGDYSIATAIASGTQEQHVQHHWVHDALVIKSLSSSVSTGLVGIPMKDISLSVEGHPG